MSVRGSWAIRRLYRGNGTHPSLRFSRAALVVLTVAFAAADELFSPEAIGTSLSV